MLRLRPTLALACAVTALVVLPGTSGAAGGSPLIGQWHLDQSTANSTPDSSGNGNTLTGNAGPIVPGRFGNAFETNDSGQSQRRVSATGLEPSRVTVMAWVKADSSPGTTRYVMAKGANGCSASSWAIYTGGQSGPGGLEFYISNGTTAVSSPAISPGSVWNGQWHAVAGTFDGARVRFYVDGNQVGSGTATSTPINYALSNRDFTIGEHPAAGTPSQCPFVTYPQAAIDEARVYNRALTAAEIKQLQQATGPTPPVLATPSAPAPAPRRRPLAAFLAKPGKAFKVKGSTLGGRLGVWLGGRVSTPGLGRIVRYKWDVDGNGTTDATCPADAPALFNAYRRAGSYNAALTVQDSGGATARVVRKVRIPATGKSSVGSAKTRAKDRRATGACITQADSQQPSTRDCIRSYFFPFVDVNARTSACFELKRRVPHTKREFGLAVGAKVNLKAALALQDYHATVRGSVAFNGIPVPLPAGAKSEYDSLANTVSIGKKSFDVPLGGRTLHLGGIDLTRVIQSNTNVFHAGTAGIGEIGALGGLGVGAKGTLDFTLDGTSRLYVNVKLPSAFTSDSGQTADAKVLVTASNTAPFRLENFHISLPYVFLGPIVARDFKLDYEARNDTWEGGTLFELPGANPAVSLDARQKPGTDNGVGFRNGGLSHAGADLGFNAATAPEIFPGVFLTHIRFRVGTHPVRLLGGVTLNSGGIVNVNGDLLAAFAYSDEPYTIGQETNQGLRRLAGRTLYAPTVIGGGDVGFDTPIGTLPLGSAYLLYQPLNNYLEFGGGVNVQLGVFSVEGEASGFAQPFARRFNIEGAGRFCAVEVGCFLGSSLLVSSSGIAACVSVGPADVGFGYDWGTSVNLFFWNCDVGGYRAHAARRGAHSSASSFNLKAGLPSAQLQVKGIGAVPRVTIRGPKGEVYSTGTRKRVIEGNLAFARVPGTQTAYIGLRKPSAGRWTVTADPGSSPIQGVRVANGLPKPKIRVKVSGKGTRRKLTYRVSKQAGLRVTFAEQGNGAYRRIGVARGAKGSFTFRPSIVAKRARTVVATIERDGLAVRNVTVGHFKAPRAVKPSKPKKVRVKRKGTALRISWRRASGAVRYAVSVKTSDGGHKLVITRKRTIRIGGIQNVLRGTVTVRGMRKDNVRGKGGRARFRRVR